MADPALVFEADDLRCERDYRPLFSGLSFKLFSGDVMQIGGHNGVGKTSLLRGICGLNSDIFGRFSWFEQDWPECRYHFSHQALFLGHLAGVKAQLSPLENLRWYFGLRQAVSDSNLEAALDQVGLYGYEHTPCFKLSAGQQRRVALARLFVSDASVWILDEPFTAIDLDGISFIEHSIANFAARGGAVLLTSHHKLQQIPCLQVLNLESFRGH